MRLGPFLATRSLEYGATPTEEISQQTPLPLKPAAQTVVARDSSYVPLPTPTPTSQPPGQTSSGLSPEAKIGLESGITLGILVVIVAIGLCVYGFSGRKSDADSDISRSCSPEPGTPNASMSNLSTRYMYPISGQRYEVLEDNTTFSHAQIWPAVPQRAPVAFGQWETADLSSHPLMNAAELEDGYAWNRYPRVPELQSGSTSPYRKLAAYSRPAELDNTGDPNPNPTVVHLIPRKQVASHVRGASATVRSSFGADMTERWHDANMNVYYIDATTRIATSG